MRRISVLVPPELVNDGQAARPAVGQHVSYYLRFSEVSPECGDELAATFEVRAEPVGDGTPIEPTRWRGGPERPPLYPTHVIADGWGATWLATRPLRGTVTVHGMLSADFGATAALHLRARGTIVRVRAVTDTVDTSDPDQTKWRAIPELRTLQDVEVSGSAAEPEAPQAYQAAEGRWEPSVSDPSVVTQREYTGMLVDIELDSAGS